MKHEELVEHLLATDGAVLVREHPALENYLVRAARCDRVLRFLPGTYIDPAAAGDLKVRVKALCRWDPHAVVCGRAAAALTYWPKLAVGPIDVASPHRRRAMSGFVFSERVIPPDLVLRIGSVAMTMPSLTAIDLATFAFTDPIDVALRSRQVTIDSLREALARTRCRRGNGVRARLLLDSRAEPWSAAERLVHRIYRRAGISGWVANHRVLLPGSGVYYLDIAFLGQRVATEVDGRIHQTDPALFESDRVRQNAVILDRWRLMRFTWLMADHDEEYVVRTTRRFLSMR